MPKSLRNFNPRSPQGGATEIYSHLSAQREISIHAPRKGERHKVLQEKTEAFLFQSTLPARGSDLHDVLRFRVARQISIHAPRKGERRGHLAGKNIFSKISIHAPRKGERRTNSALCCSMLLFQSTLPARGSDPYALTLCGYGGHFNPRSPQGGATFLAERVGFEPLLFQSTLPARGSDWRNKRYVVVW